MSVDIKETDIEPLNQGLNDAILSISSTLLPAGFDVSDDAPGTYKALRAHLDAGKRLVVYSGGCEGTIYVDPAVNHAFRAWHDFSHWKGGHDFSVEGECGVFEMQRRHLLDVYGESPETRRWIEILRAEVIGQRLFYEYYKRYVDDQRGFIEAYLKDPRAALSLGPFGREISNAHQQLPVQGPPLSQLPARLGQTRSTRSEELGQEVNQEACATDQVGRTRSQLRLTDAHRPQDR